MNSPKARLDATVVFNANPRTRRRKERRLKNADAPLPERVEAAP
jgi:hypothetical protein